MKDLTIGVAAAEKLAAGLVEDRKLAGKIHVWPEMDPDGSTPQGALHTMPMEAIVETMAELVAEVCREAGGKPTAVGIGFPGIVHEGIVEESPNLRQAKGAKLAAMLGSALESLQLPMPVFLYNDADVAAAGLAAIRGKRSDHDAIRVWTLGTGVGFGRYPAVEGVWEGGHTVVTLDPKEGYCGCGGRGHLEGIMGERAMRLRFLDLEPHEVFERAKEGDERCRDFVKLWHRALAAATASSIHIAGPGRFYVTGRYSRFIDVTVLHRYLHEMVTMTPLQGSVFEVIETNDEVAVIGAGVNAQLSFAAMKAALECAPKDIENS